MIDHGALTDLVLETLAAAVAANPDVTTGKEPPIGDGVAPAGGGWVEGQPGNGVFVPYGVLASGGGAPRALDLGGHVPGFAIGFSLRAHGGSRSQCDWMATVLRSSIEGLSHQTFGADPWKIINIEWPTLGPVSRVDAVAPPFWQVFDTFNLICST